jgi:hypothetical protein
MTKEAPALRASNRPSWQTSWPINGDLKAWMKTMISKCHFIEKLDEALKCTQLPIETLADLGDKDEALQQVDQFLRSADKRVSTVEVVSFVSLAELGASIAIRNREPARMEGYLAIAEATERHLTDADRGFAEDSVRWFRASHGLLDPRHAVDDHQRTVAEFELADRQLRMAMDTGDCEEAKRQAAILKTIALATPNGLRLERLRRATLGLLIVGMKNEVAFLTKEVSGRNLDSRTLADFGLREQALERCGLEIARELSRLGSSADPDVTTPVRRMCRSLDVMWELGHRDEAAACLRRAIREMPTWRALGWSPRAVARFLREAAERLDVLEGSAEVSRAISIATKSESANPLDQTIENFRRIRSAKSRRGALAPFLARAELWQELFDLLQVCQTPMEAAELCWSVKFELPGGEGLLV